MRKIKSVIATSLFAFIFWILFVVQDINLLHLDIQEVLVGVVVSLIVGYITSPLVVKEDGFYLFKEKRLLNLLAYIPFYMKALMLANIEVAKKAFSKNIKIKPGIVKVETELKSDYGLSFLSNSITLTPGTIVVDICEEEGRNYLYVHSLEVPSENMKENGEKIKGDFEKRIRGIYK